MPARKLQVHMGLSLYFPCLCPQQRPVQDLGPWGKVCRGRNRNGLGASGEEGAQPACHWSWAAPHSTHRITPVETLHFPCVLGKCTTGTKVLRKDKGVSARHKGQLSGQGKTQAAKRMLLCACASEEEVLRGEVSLGPPGTCLSGEGGGSTREKEPLISCLSSSSPAHC